MIMKYEPAVAEYEWWWSMNDRVIHVSFFKAEYVNYSIGKDNLYVLKLF